MIGQVVGNFRILEKLGEGGMGEVFRALDLILEREVALKALRLELASQHDIAERFRTEAVVLARLNHPNIATLYSVFPHAERLFMVLEFVRGDSLDALIVRRRTIPWREAVGLIQQALDGLEHAHRMGVVHRDIKPGNMMINSAGALKLMDFGIARILDRTRLTKTGHTVGTLHYMSPEQLQGREVDLRCDLYSTGVVLYEMVTGSVPFDKSSDYDVIKAQVEAPPPYPRTLMPDLPARLEQIILRALAKDPGERFQHAADFRIALESLVERAPSSPLPFPSVSGRLGETRWSGSALDALNADQRPGRTLRSGPSRLRGVAATAIEWLQGIKWKASPGVLVLLALLGISGALVLVATRSNAPPVPDVGGLARAPRAEAPTGDVGSSGSATSVDPASTSLAHGPEQAPSPAHDKAQTMMPGDEQRRSKRGVEDDAQRQEATRITPNVQGRVRPQEEARLRTQDEGRTRPQRDASLTQREKTARPQEKPRPMPEEARTQDDARVKTNEASRDKADQETRPTGNATGQPAAASRLYAASVDHVWTTSEAVLKNLGWDIDERDRNLGWILTESRSLDKDNFGVYEKSLRHRLRLLIRPAGNDRTSVTVERIVFRRQRVLWLNKDETIVVNDPGLLANQQLEQGVLSAIARSFR